MSRETINEKMNEYKIALNTNNGKISNCEHAIDSFSKLMQYFESRKTEIEKRKSGCFFAFLLLLPISLLMLPVSIPLAIGGFVCSVIFIERSLFFKNVITKFNKCYELLNSTIAKLKNKHDDSIQEKDFLIEQITKLEKLIEETIVEEKASTMPDITFTPTADETLECETIETQTL